MTPLFNSTRDMLSLNVKVSMVNVKFFPEVILSIFKLESFFFAPEMFIGYSILQLSLYSIVIKFISRTETSYKPDFTGFGIYIFSASLLLLFNDSTTCFFLMSASNSTFINDYFASVCKILIAFSIVAFFLSVQFVRSKVSLINSFEYYSFISSASLGAMLICSANDFIAAYLALELQSISLYLMACSKKNSNYSIESGLKYFIIGSFSSMFFLFGSSLIYGTCGTINFQELQVILSYWSNFQTIYELNSIHLGFFFVATSLLIKLAAAPFHLWSIDVYESAPSASTYFFSVVPKISLFVLLTKIFYSIGFSLNFSGSIYGYFSLFALFSIIVGSLGGIEQRRLKSLLAYSSVGHTGYLLLSISTGLEFGGLMVFYYLSFYIISSVCLWAIVMFLKKKSPTKLKFNKELGDLSLLYKSNFMLAIVTSTTLFSLSGVPPVVGFLIKFGAFFVAIESSAYLLAVLGILLTVISTFYYLRVVKIIFFEKVTVGKLYCPITSAKAAVIAKSFLLLFLFFVEPSLVYLVISKLYLTSLF